MMMIIISICIIDGGGQGVKGWEPLPHFTTFVSVPGEWSRGFGVLLLV